MGEAGTDLEHGRCLGGGVLSEEEACISRISPTLGLGMAILRQSSSRSKLFVPLCGDQVGQIGRGGVYVNCRARQGAFCTRN
jgi:hypothetical protein